MVDPLHKYAGGRDGAAIGADALIPTHDCYDPDQKDKKYQLESDIHDLKQKENYL